MRAPSPRPLLCALPFAVALLGCSSPEAPAEPELGTSAAAITAAAAIANAEEWVTAKLLYCQSPNGANDSIDPSCPTTCVRTSNPAWDPYRSDCSGLVSWAWGLPAPGRTTADFAPNTSDITSPIQASSLAMGDAVNTDDTTSSDHHIMLFKAWMVAGQQATFIEEPGCSATPDYAHEFTSAVTLNGTQITVQYNGMTFTAIRYGGLTGGGGTGDGGTGGTYAAKYVSQTWPLSSAAPIQATVGQTQKGSIDMTNTGTATWAAGVVKLAPIPRDQPSNFQAASWLSPTRVSTLAADVPPGSVGHFEWDLDPSQAGSFQPYFGLVAEGITWFADSGGPPDDDLQVNLVVAPGQGTTSSSSTGSSSGSGGASAGSTSSGSVSGGSGGATGTGTAGGSTGAGAGKAFGNPGTSSGCQIGPVDLRAAPPATGLGLLAALLVARRRRRAA